MIKFLQGINTMAAVNNSNTGTTRNTFTKPLTFGNVYTII